MRCAHTHARALAAGAVEESIRCGGLADIKTQRIKACGTVCRHAAVSLVYTALLNRETSLSLLAVYYGWQVILDTLLKEQGECSLEYIRCALIPPLHLQAQALSICCGPPCRAASYSASGWVRVSYTTLLTAGVPCRIQEAGRRGDQGGADAVQGRRQEDGRVRADVLPAAQGVPSRHPRLAHCKVPRVRNCGP